MPVSESLLNSICNVDNFLALPGFAPNVPLLEFPRLSSPGCEVILLPDPYPSEACKMENGHFWEIPLNALDHYYQNLSSVCNSLGVRIFPQPASTLSQKYATKPKYARLAKSGRIDHHLSNEFLGIYLRELG